MKKSKKNQMFSLSVPPEWLAQRADLAPWEKKGKKKFWAKILSFYSQNAPQVVDVEPTTTLSEDDRLTSRIFSCWIHHWESFGTDKNAFDVAKSVAQGQGAVGGGKLGGNPFFDLILASALCDRQNRAIERFEKTYLNALRKVAAKIDPQTGFEHDALPYWWGAFYMHLTGMTSERSKPALDSYGGYAALKVWLRIALALFLRRFMKKEKGRETDFSDLDSENQKEQKVDEETGFTDILEEATAFETDAFEQDDKRNFVKRFVLALRKARRELTGDEWNRLFYHFAKKLQNRQIARLYKEDEGTTSRRRAAALAKFRAALKQAMAKDSVLSDLYDRIFNDWGKEMGWLIEIFFNQKKI